MINRVAAVEAGELEALLPLIEAYQRICELGSVERGHNRGFFGRMIAPSRHGALIGAWRDEAPVGYACVHWGLDSLAAREIADLRSLYVRSSHRGSGIATRLTGVAAELARARGSKALLWRAGPNNEAAELLSRKLGAANETATSFELRL